MAVLLDRLRRVRDLIDLQETEVVMADNQVLELLADGLGNAPVNLRSADDDAPVLAHLTESSHLGNGNLLGLQAVPEDMNLIEKKDDAISAVRILKLRIVLKRLDSLTNAPNVHIRDETRTRVPGKHILGAKHRR